ncbi:MAG TPA: hypothetical protein DCR12_05335, partial [Lachnospiraceae bacterium]|nr:hypothetical protein [Lachnospiraceae bacterium]
MEDNKAKENKVDENKKAEEKKKLSLRSRIIITIAVVVVLIGVAWLVYYLVDYKRGQSIYDDINKNYTASNGDEWYNKIDVNIAELKQKNPDTRGWLYF